MSFVDVFQQSLILFLPVILLAMIFQLQFRKIFLYFVIYIIGVYIFKNLSLHELIYALCGLIMQVTCLYLMITPRKLKNILYIFVVLFFEAIVNVIVKIGVQVNYSQENSTWLFVRLIMMIIYLGVWYYLKKNNIVLTANKMRNKALLFMIIVFVLIDLLLEILQYATTQLHIRFLILIAITIVLILAMAYTILKNNMLLDKRNNQYENELKQQKQQRILQEKYTNDRIESYQHLQKFKHDILGYLTAIDFMVKEQRYDDLNVYVNAMKVEVNDQRLTCPNIYISAVLSSVAARLKEQDIHFQFDYDVIGKIEMKDLHISVLFYNLMTNAIEAVEKVEQRKDITLSILQKDNAIQIKIANNVVNPENINFDVSDKEHSELHGFGMKSINEIIEEYNGSMEYQIIDNTIVIDIILIDVISDNN